MYYVSLSQWVPCRAEHMQPHNTVPKPFSFHERKQSNNSYARKKAVSHQQQMEEEALKECTFKPRTTVAANRAVIQRIMQTPLTDEHLI